MIKNFLKFLLGVPLSIGLEISVHFLTLILPVLVIMQGWKSNNLFLLTLCVLLAWIIYPYLILLISGTIMRLLPKPQMGYMDNESARFKYEKLMVLNAFVKRSAARGLLRLPFNQFYYQLVGTKMDNTVTFSDPDILSDPFFVSIGKNTILGYGSLVFCHHHVPNSSENLLGRVEIGNNVLIGSRSIIWANVTIGDNSVVQSGSVVRPGTIIPSNEVWGGIPACKLRSIASTSSFHPIQTEQDLVNYLQQYLSKYNNLVDISLEVPLLNMGLEVTDISRLLVHCEKIYHVFIDRTQVDLTTYSLKDLVKTLSN